MRCEFCDLEEWHDVSGYGLAVEQCKRCDREVCEKCAEIDCDVAGEGEMRCVQWDCPACIHGWVSEPTDWCFEKA